MTPAHIEAIERATLGAVIPEAQEEVGGWLLPFDSGTVGRAKSAVPLSHAAPDASVLARIEAAYAARGLPAALRVPCEPPFESFRAMLAAAGYIEHTLTDVCTAEASGVAALSQAAAAEVSKAPHDAWASVFLGEGFDPVDGASRIRKLSQGADTLFATVRDGDTPVAAGAAAFSHGWASVHGMRTASACRGRGLAARVLATLAREAMRKGYGQVFLQVAADNAAAQSLYRRAGFEKRWSYAYWRQATATSDRSST
jgi:N-acetylglutamate synthase